MIKYNRMLYLGAWLAVLLCGLWGGGALAPILLFLMLLLPVFSGIRLYLSMDGLIVSMEGEHSCHAGQPMELRLKMQYTFWRPVGKVWLSVYGENHVLGTTSTESYLLELGAKRQQEYHIALDTDTCGGKSVYIKEMLCYDLLGLFSRHKKIEEGYSYLVYPYEAQMYVTLYRRSEREQPGELYDGRKSGTDVSEVFGLRAYQEGDPLQSIHWKLSSKMKELIVREFGRPVNYHTLLLLSPSFCYGERKVEEPVVSSVFDLGVSLSRALLNQNMAHFVGYLSGNRVCCLPVDSLHSYEEMLLKLMHNSVQKNGDETLLSFLHQQLYRQYTKVVYIAGAVEEAVAGNLSVLVDVTVLLATEGASGYLTENKSYTVIGIPIEQIRSGEHIIPL